MRDVMCGLGVIIATGGAVLFIAALAPGGQPMSVWPGLLLTGFGLLFVAGSRRPDPATMANFQARVAAREADKAARFLPAKPPPSVSQLVAREDLDTELYIRYRDAKGKPTRRKVTVHAIEGFRAPDGRVTFEHIRGYCHVRRAARTFRVDRIIDAADADGVVIGDFQAWLLHQTTR
jgi:hypothetical protein